MDMEDMLLDEVRRDVLERPKPTLDLDSLISFKRQVQDLTDQTNSELKRNVYQNYSLFIETSKEISTLKTEMRELNILLDKQHTSISKLIDQLNKTSIIPPSLDRPKIDSFRLELNDDTSEVEAEILPSWFTKSPEDFDVLIAQRNLKEAVELAQRVRAHLEQYPKCCEGNHADLKTKIDSRVQELINAICSELQPSTDRSIQRSPRSSVFSIQLLRELNLSAKAAKLYLDQRSSLLRFVLKQQKMESTTTFQFIKQMCSIFFHHIIETFNEFKQAFEIDKSIAKAMKDSEENLGIEATKDVSGHWLRPDLIRLIYLSRQPLTENDTVSDSYGESDHISSHILINNSEKMLEGPTSKDSKSNVFNDLATYSCFTYWAVQEFENFTVIFRNQVFDNLQISTSIVAESVYYFNNQCSKITSYCGINMSKLIQRQMETNIRKVIDQCERKLFDTISKLDNEENWQPQQFQNNGQMTRFFEEMNDVGLKTMPSYIFDDHKLRFTACKTSFARCYLITLNEMAKVSFIVS